MTTVATQDPRPQQGCGGCQGCGGGSPQGSPTDRAHDCGCAPEEACGLECLERPMFTAGMVLSDSDLTALVDWSRGRLDLQRHRQGWGVVCGLDVRCDPDHPGRVLVLSGYAVGCCGEDMVLCETRTVDLTGCCGTATPCGSTDDPAGSKDPGKPGDTGTQDGTSTDTAASPEPPDPCGDVVVDLLLTPAESPAVPGLVSTCSCGSGGSGCGGTCGAGEEQASDGRLVPTRIREGAVVAVHTVAFPEADPDQAAADRAQQDYAACHAVVTRLAELGVKLDGQTDKLVRWLEQQRLDPPCHWWSRLCAALAAAEDGATEAILVSAMLDLVVDCRHRALRRPCASCSSDEVGLARVWLRRTEDARGVQTCEVTHIDAYPPFRRELGLSTRPVPQGAEDLTSYIWQRWDQVCRRWRVVSGDMPPSVRDFPVALTQLAELFEDTTTLWWPCGERPPTPVLVDIPCLGRRVVGFEQRSRQDGGVLEPAPASEPLNLQLEDVRGLGQTWADRLRAASYGTVEEVAMLSVENLADVLGLQPGARVAAIRDAAELLVREGR